MIIIGVVIFLFVFYSAIIIFYNNSWRGLAVYKANEKNKKTLGFSVIIPVRNEEHHIGRLLTSLENQSYDKQFFEVIVVDDHSTDNTADIVSDNCKDFENLKVVSLTGQVLNSYKKKAIEAGIATAKNEWIICTDGDCIVPDKWLETYAEFIVEKNPVFIAAPVKLSEPEASHSRLLFFFQALDFMTLQGITGASVYKKVHSMCNGANLAYRKEVFYEVNGFKGVDDIASGDDMLLMHKIWKKHPKKIAYLKSGDVIVETAAAPTLEDFFNQRIRWASKAKYYDDKRIFWVLLLVYLFNFFFLVLTVASFFNIKYLYTLLILWVLKTTIEFPFMMSVARFFRRQNLLKYFFFFQPLHIAYTIVSGFLGSFGKYEWKGRRVR